MAVRGGLRPATLENGQALTVEGLGLGVLPAFQGVREIGPSVATVSAGLAQRFRRMARPCGRGPRPRRTSLTCQVDRKVIVFVAGPGVGLRLGATSARWPALRWKSRPPAYLTCRSRAYRDLLQLTAVSKWVSAQQRLPDGQGLAEEGLDSADLPRRRHRVKQASLWVKGGPQWSSPSVFSRMARTLRWRPGQPAAPTLAMQVRREVVVGPGGSAVVFYRAIGGRPRAPCAGRRTDSPYPVQRLRRGLVHDLLTAAIAQAPPRARRRSGGWAVVHSQPRIGRLPVVGRPDVGARNSTLPAGRDCVAESPCLFELLDLSFQLPRPGSSPVRPLPRWRRVAPPGGSRRPAASRSRLVPPISRYIRPGSDEQRRIVRRVAWASGSIGSLRLPGIRLRFFVCGSKILGLASFTPGRLYARMNAA